MKDSLITPADQVLVTGASGFVGNRVVASLLERGFGKVRCFTRPSSDTRKIEALISQYGPRVQIEVIQGNLLDQEDCIRAAQGIAVIYHLAAATGQKSIPHAFLNSVVTTRNLLDASLRTGSLKRFVNLSSFAVYTNTDKPHGRLLDESCPSESHPELRGDAYSYAKLKQDQLVMQYGQRHGLPYVLLRPGVVFGPGKAAITGRVGLDTFGVFLHLGGSNPIPLTYVDNCADAIVLAGLVQGVDGEVFNIVDDDLPSSRQFLRLYKKNVDTFRSIFLPHALSYLLCYCWEAYARWSRGQLPLAYNRRMWYVYWKRSRYSNGKLKDLLGWHPRISMTEGLDRFFAACRNQARYA